MLAFNRYLTGVGRSKKKAKQAAAEKLLSLVKNNLDIETLSSPNSLENFGDPHSQVGYTCIEDVSLQMLFEGRGSGVAVVFLACNQRVAGSNPALATA